MANATTPVIQINEGKVGIGISNPTTPLHLIGIAQIVTGTNTAFYEGASVRMFGAQNYSFLSSGGNTRAIIDVNASGVSAGNLSLYNANTVRTTLINNSGNSFFNGGNVGIGTTGAFSKLQTGLATFTGANGMFTNSRVGISNHGILTGMMLASTYNDAAHPEYGLVFVQGPSTSSYNVWSISPDGPAKGSGLNFHYQAQSANIHAPTNAKVTFEGSTGNVGIGTDSPVAKLHVNVPGSSDGYAVGGKNLSMTTAFQTGAQLEITLGDHQGCYVKVFITGDWGNHSAIAFMGEYFIQNGANGYAEPGMIIREVENTHTVDSLSSQIYDGGNVDSFQIQFKLNRTLGTTTTSANLTYQVMGQFDSIT